MNLLNKKLVFDMINNNKNANSPAERPKKLQEKYSLQMWTFALKLQKTNHFSVFYLKCILMTASCSH